ncbi:diguanylate cyclase domain-containing protein [Piscinibacter sp.]|uniref:GGDEF domain-containing protein n=1 Tax=Piscinibacter sp. TaxID=1903157 RepID=UPI0039E3D7AF
MDAPRTPTPRPGAEVMPAQIAKAALRRLVLDKLEPTPDNYARAYAREAGEPTAGDGAALAELIGKLVSGIERGGRHWTAARRKDSLLRVLEGSRSDARRLQQRLTQLVASWGSDTPDGTIETAPAALDEPPPWGRVVAALGAATCRALPPPGEEAEPLAQALGRLVERVVREGASVPLADELDALCRRAGIVLQHRHHLVEQLGALCRELTASLGELAEDDSWAKGQCDAMRVKLDEGLSARGVKAVGDLLRDTRERQSALRGEREKAREALKTLINRMLSELDELGSQTGRFHDSVGRYADVIEKADSLESLAGVVREMVEESRTVQALVQQTQGRLKEEHVRASALTARVGELESELRRLSNEVSTDQLTQIANRRGLLHAFDAERSRVERDGAALAVGLLDIDNFKRLNDELGHAAGDEALRSLAAVASRALRPSDMVARYGGEEFVVLLPATLVEEGQQILTRLQRSLSGGLFMHENKQVFVTFSAGVTAYRAGETIEAALERADQALYEAKRAGKNRTCIG